MLVGRRCNYEQGLEDFAPRRHGPDTDADAEIASVALSAARLPTSTGYGVGSTDKANGAAGFSVGWHSAPPIPMPATPVLTDTLLITFRSCAAPLQSGCVARMLNIWDLDAYCIPGVHDSYRANDSNNTMHNHEVQLTCMDHHATHNQ